MIQRKQSLLLLAAAIIHVLLVFIPSVLVKDDQGIVQGLGLINQKGIIKGSGVLSVATILNFASLLVCMTAIFLYKKRSMQRLQCLILSMVNLVLAVLLIALPLVDKGLTSSKNWVVYLPIIGALLCFMAARFIQKDIDLLKSADRIR
jgi:uncharacterized membrane protein YhdT